jgi:hypothetical protein
MSVQAHNECIEQKARWTPPKLSKLESGRAEANAGIGGDLSLLSS